MGEIKRNWYGKIVNGKKGARPQPSETFDWDKAIRLFHKTLEEVYGKPMHTLDTRKPPIK